MPTIEEIRRQVEQLKSMQVEKGFIKSFFVTKKEINHLPEILDKDEKIRAICSGFMDGVTWLGVCTNKRIIFLHRGMIFGIKQVQVPLDRVQSIDHQAGLFFGEIRIWDGASAITLGMVLKTSVLLFVKATKDAVDEFKRGFAQPQTASQAGADIATQLEKLAVLREKGHLSEVEFQQQKKKLLGI